MTLRFDDDQNDRFELVFIDSSIVAEKGMDMLYRAMQSWVSKLLIMLCFIQGAVAFSLVPTQPSNTDIVKIFDTQLGQKLLFHKPFDLPIEVERTHKSLIKQIEPWVKLGLITKQKTRFLAEKIMYGELREVSVGGFKYSYNQDSPLIGEKGIFYGRPSVQEIFSVSQVSDISGEFFCEVYLSWHVNDMPDWVAKVDIKQRENRLLRRALESHKRPFEKRLQLILISDEWQLWQGREGQKSPQSLF